MTDRNIRVLTGRGMFTVPDRAVGVSVATSASANTYGSWVQVSPFEDFDLLMHGLHVGPSTAIASTVTYVDVQVGHGVAGTGGEVALSTFRFQATEQATGVAKPAWTTLWLPYPVYVPAGSRIVARAKQNVASAYTRLVSIVASRARDEEVVV